MLFSDSFCQFSTQHLDGSRYVTSNPQLLCKNFRKKVSLFLQLHKKNSMFVKTTASPITTTRRVFYLLVNIILYYMEKLRNCYIYWIHFVSPINTLTVYIPCSSTDLAEKFFAKSGIVFDNVQRAIFFNQRNRGMDKMQSIAKKRLLRKNFKQHFMSALQKNKSTQTSGSVFVERIEKPKRLHLNWN